MRSYIVVYRVAGVHYRYRCTAKNKMDARRQCCEAMGITMKDIVSVEEGV